MRRDYGVVTVKKIWTSKRIVTALMIVFMFLFAMIALLTYYGQNVGCFTISMSDKASNQSIYISTDPTFDTYSPRLICDSLYQAKNIPYPIIKYERARATDGIYVSEDKSYIGYTFYLKNMGDETVSLKEQLSISQETKNVSSCCWLWEFEGDNDNIGTIYQKEDKNYKAYPSTYRSDNKEYFKSDTLVFSKNIEQLEPQEVLKVTLILWIEGEDPDCTDQILGGQINFNLEFTLVSESDKE
ncbi:MAG: hypothetical protein K6G28_04880 [Acholeplasmatales bacterium]|nr:hypothetical protein [Acholeplasmatales bacterium]